MDAANYEISMDCENSSLYDMVEEKPLKTTHKVALGLAAMGLIYLTGMGVQWAAKDHRTTVAVREALRIDVFQGRGPLPVSVEKYIEQYAASMDMYEKRYELPKGVLLEATHMELGSGDKATTLGMDAYSEQFLKAFINDTRSVLGDEGDMTRDGSHHLGLSFGLLNIKPGLVNLHTIHALKNEELKASLLAKYNCDKEHADDDQIRMLASDFVVSLELLAATMSVWKDYINTYAEGENFSAEQRNSLYALVISTFSTEPDTGENFYSWFARDGYAVPRIRDQDVEGSFQICSSVFEP